LIQDLRREAKGSNVHVLENNAVEVGGFVFLGCSLWTDFQLWPNAREAMMFANQEMSDFWLIKNPTSTSCIPPKTRQNVMLRPSGG